MSTLFFQILLIILLTGTSSAYTTQVPESQPVQTPQPVPGPSLNYTNYSDICPQNYEPLFTCTDGKWISNIMVTLHTDTKLENATFMMMKNVYVVGQGHEMNFVTLWINNNLIVASNTSLLLNNVNLRVGGDFYFQSGSLLIIDMTGGSQFHVNGTAHLKGALLVTIDSNQMNQELVVLSAGYVNGSFSDVQINTKNQPSSCKTSNTKVSYGSEISVLFSIKCNSSTALWIWCIIGVVLCLILIGIGLAVFLVIRKKQKQKIALVHLKQNLVEV